MLFLSVWHRKWHGFISIKNGQLQLKKFWLTTEYDLFTKTVKKPQLYPDLAPSDYQLLERPHRNTVHIRTRYQKLAWFILGCQAGAVLLGWNPQISRKIGKSHSFRWAILWIILLYMFFLNKRSNFEKKPHELSYRYNIIAVVLTNGV